PFPDRKEFDLYAVANPAREVGGDFYDFFCIDEKHLGLVIGDVSGKGVPAALFMAITRTLIKTAATDELCPKATLEKVNSIIYPENPSSMFVTVFYAVYNTETGNIYFANAGHNLPFIKRTGGRVETVHKTRSIALGIMKNLELEKSTLKLNQGDSILFYTDGLTEAENGIHDMFEEERVEQFLKDLPQGNNMRNVIDLLLKSVEKFVGGVEQFDDITILALKRLI
ncbi:serine/threonine-protein phosphatase, partial [candidate division KSB1 bacterium]|nr:serine/threonine-protein phosphatase [candidate division KSB1 bacterium]